MSGSDIFLSVRDIWKTYAAPHGGGSRPVLQGLDFCLERGEMAGLVGESGSGKSTLARLLLGLERPDRGIVLLEGQPLRQWRAGGGRLSVVFQDYVTSVDPGFTLAEAVDEGLGPGCRLSRRERRREVDRLLVLDQGRCAEHLPVSQLGSARSPRLRRMLETVVPFRSAWEGRCDEAAGTGRAPGATKV